MQPLAVECVVDAACAVGESPVWVPHSQSLWWVDIAGRQLWRWQASHGGTQRWPLPQQAGCIARVESSDEWPHGQWLAAMEDGVARITPHAQGTLSTEWLCRIQHPSPGMRFNDGRCDRQGRLWVSSMVMDMALAKPSGQWHALRQNQLPLWRAGQITPNGLAFSPDGRRMYFSDSHPKVQQVWACDYDPDTGQASTPRPFIDFLPLPGRPDGAAVDCEGCYWICGNDAGLVHRFTPDGKLDRSVALPVPKPAMCAFGGAQLDTLFVTSIRTAALAQSHPLSGGVFAFRPGVQGLAEPCWNPLS